MYEHIGRTTFLFVPHDSVVDGIEDNEHTDRLQCLAEIADVIADQTAFRIDVGGLCEGIERTVRKQLDRKSDVLRFGFGLLQKLLVEVFERRNLSGAAALDKRTVHDLRTTVDQGFLLCGKLSASYELFAKRQDKLALQKDRILGVRIFGFHIHSIDVVLGVGSDIDDFAAERTDKSIILALRVNDNDVALIPKHKLDDFILCEERLTGTGYAEYKAVAVQKRTAVDKQQVFTDRVLSAVDAFRVIDLLCLERHKDSGGFRGQRSERIDLPKPVGKRGVQPVKLLILQRLELADMLSSNGEQRFRVGIQLLLAVSDVD